MNRCRNTRYMDTMAVVLPWVLCCKAVASGGAGPNIEIWYGSTQEFGQVGTPVPTMNLLGNVSTPVGVASLSFSLNGGPNQPLSMGPNKARLAQAGDFNIELPFNSTPLGSNEVLITAVDKLGNPSQASVTVINSTGPVWPLPYSINWSTVTNINSVSQILDGLWTLDGGIVRPVVDSYDRLIAIGDLSWTDYQVTVPITLHFVDPNGYDPPAYGPALGVLLRWPGHSPDGSQPQQGVYPLGGLCMFRWTSSYERFEIFGNNGVILAASRTGELMQLDTTYIFKARVESVSGATKYSFKWWTNNQAEPTNWLLVGQQTNDPGHGCLLLLAQYVHADFGNVNIERLNVGRLQVTLLPSEAANAGAQWRRVNTSTWYNSGDSETEVPIGPQTIEFKTVVGWDSPSQKSVTIIESQTTTASASYSMQTGSLSVTLAPVDAVTAGARWRRVGTSIWYGNNATETGIPIGSYLIEFSDLTGWTTPDDIGVVITKNQSSSATATYMLQTGSLQVTLTPADVVTAGARWRRVGTTVWYESNTTETNIPIGSYSIEFQDVAGWTAPLPLNISISKDALSTVTANYSSATGSLQVNLNPPDAVTAGAQWRLVGTQVWRNNGDRISGILPGSCRIEFRSLPYWITPATRELVIAENEVMAINAFYTRRTGSLQINLTPPNAVNAGAQWRRVGTDSWFESGHTEIGVPTGTHAIEFKEVIGWTTPTSLDVAIADTQLTSVEANYIQQMGSLQVTLLPATAVAAGARWRIDGSDWLTNETIVNALPIGTRTISFNSIEGFTSPSASQITILANQTTLAIGAYTAVAPQEPQKFTLTILATGGATSPAPAIYDDGTIVQVNAPDPPDGLIFHQWSGDLNSTDNPLTVVMNRDIALTANYIVDSTNQPPILPFCGAGLVEGSMLGMLGLGFVAQLVRRRSH